MNIAMVLSVNKSDTHSMKKECVRMIKLVEGHGVEGDAHYGKTIKHLYRVAKDPHQPNLRQVHLIHSELLSELVTKGFNINPGAMGENITTTNIDLLSLPRDAILSIGKIAKIQIKGLRNPCHQLDGIQKGLMKAVLDRDDHGNLIRKTGVMGVVIKSGEVTLGDEIRIEMPNKPYLQLEPV